MDNLDKLIEAIEHPENLTSEELTGILSDPETEKLYERLCYERGKACADDPLDNEQVEMQWRKFKRTNRKPSFFSWLMRSKTVAVVALAIISCSIVAVGISIKMTKAGNESVADVSPAEEIQAAPQVIKKDTVLRLANDTVILFEDEKLDVILNKVAPYYNVKVNLRSKAAKDVRLFLKWDPTVTLEELIENLNTFDRINLTLNDSILTDL